MRSMPQPDRILMGPGPCNPYPEVIEAFARPMLGHLDPEFLALLDETCDRLRTVFRTANALTLPVSGTGSAGMEAAFVNVGRPGRRRRRRRQRPVRRAHVRRRRPLRCRGRAGRRRRGAGRSIPPVLAAHPAPKVIAVVHAETSTGVRNDIARSAPARATRCCSSTASRRSAASPSRSTGGASTSRTAARRSASACRPGWRRSP